MNHSSCKSEVRFDSWQISCRVIEATSSQKCRFPETFRENSAEHHPSTIFPGKYPQNHKLLLIHESRNLIPAHFLSHLNPWSLSIHGKSHEKAMWYPRWRRVCLRDQSSPRDFEQRMRECTQKIDPWPPY